MPDFNGGTIAGNILPDTTGRDLGSSAARWDAFLQNVDISGSIAADSINGIIFASAYATLQLAVNAAITAGGGVVILDRNETLTSQLVVGNSTTKPQITVVFLPGVKLTVNITSGGSAIVLHDSCVLRGTFGFHSNGGSVDDENIYVASTAVISALIVNGDKTGSQQSWCIEKMYLKSHASASVTWMLDFTGGSVGTYFRDVEVNNFPQGGLRWIASGSVISSDILFDNVTIAGAPATANTPVHLEAPVGTTGGISNFYFNRLQVENGGNNVPLVKLLGNGGSGGSSVNNIYFQGLRLETGGATGVDGVDIIDSNTIVFHSVNAADGGDSVVKISQTGASKTFGIEIQNLHSYNWTNAVEDTINSVTIAAESNIAHVPLYTIDARYWEALRIQNQAVSDGRGVVFEDLRMDWSSNQGRLFTNSGGGGSARNLQIGTGGSASLVMMTNSSNRWSVSATGHFLCQSDNNLDIGAAGATRPRTIYVGTSVVVPTVTASTAVTAPAITASSTVSSPSVEATTLEKITTPEGGVWTRSYASELMTLNTGGTTTDSAANLLPANAIIESVVARVTTTITGAATGWSLGDTTTAARFRANDTNLTAGSTGVGLAHQQGSIATDATGPVQTSAAKVRITAAGGNPSAGAIRVTVFYSQFTPPTS